MDFGANETPGEYHYYYDREGKLKRGGKAVPFGSGKLHYPKR